VEGVGGVVRLAQNKCSGNRVAFFRREACPVGNIDQLRKMFR
jgi:hypothetical protein